MNYLRSVVGLNLQSTVLIYHPFPCSPFCHIDFIWFSFLLIYILTFPILSPFLSINSATSKSDTKICQTMIRIIGSLWIPETTTSRKVTTNHKVPCSQPKTLHTSTLPSLLLSLHISSPLLHPLWCYTTNQQLFSYLLIYGVGQLWAYSWASFHRSWGPWCTWTAP